MDSPPAWTQWLVLIGSLVYTSWLIFDWKFRVRRAAINVTESKYDDYWFRQVVCPTCITPLLELAKFTTGKVASINPVDRGTGHPTEEWKYFFREFTSRRISVSNTSVFLAVYGEQFSTAFDGHLEALEDDLAEFVDKYRNTPPDDSFKQLEARNLMVQGTWLRCRTVIRNIADEHAQLTVVTKPLRTGG